MDKLESDFIRTKNDIDNIHQQILIKRNDIIQARMKYGKYDQSEGYISESINILRNLSEVNLFGSRDFDSEFSILKEAKIALAKKSGIRVTPEVSILELCIIGLGLNTRAAELEGRIAKESFLDRPNLRGVRCYDQADSRLPLFLVESRDRNLSNTIDNYPGLSTTKYAEDAVRANSNGAKVKNNIIKDVASDESCFYRKGAHRDGIQITPLANRPSQKNDGFAAATLDDVLIDSNNISSIGKLQCIFAGDGLFTNLTISNNTVSTNGQHKITIYGMLSGTISGNNARAVLRPLRIGGGFVGNLLITGFSERDYYYGTPNGGDPSQYQDNRSINYAPLTHVHRGNFPLDKYLNEYNDDRTKVSSLAYVEYSDVLDVLLWLLPHVVYGEPLSANTAQEYISNHYTDHISDLSGKYRGAFAQELAFTV